MAKAVYAGTFDPVTLGHLHIIRRAARLFETLTVAVAASTGKRTVFTAEERASLVREEAVSYTHLGEPHDFRRQPRVVV